MNDLVNDNEEVVTVGEMAWKIIADSRREYEKLISQHLGMFNSLDGIIVKNIKAVIETERHKTEVLKEELERYEKLNDLFIESDPDDITCLISGDYKNNKSIKNFPKSDSDFLKLSHNERLKVTKWILKEHLRQGA